MITCVYNGFAVLFAVAAIIAMTGCKPGPSAPAKGPPPAKAPAGANEQALATVTLTPEAEQRLGVTTVAAAIKPVGRTRTFGGELIVALGRPKQAAQSNSASIF